MSRIMQPSNQIRLTNVSLVRLKKGKKRFEIACYKNKVLEWRQGIETDLDEVLQIPSVFLNVSKGQTAPAEDLARAFGRDRTQDDIVLEILNKGELQVGERERAAQMDRVHHEVVGIVASKLVDPRTKRVYTTGMKALDMLSSQAHNHPPENNNNNSNKSGTATPANGDDQDAAGAKPRDPATNSGGKEHSWTGVVTTKSAKSQALEAKKALIAHQPIPVARARMRLRITCPTSVLKQAVKAPAGGSSGGGNDGGGGGGGDGAAKSGGKGKGKGKKGGGGGGGGGGGSGGGAGDEEGVSGGGGGEQQKAAVGTVKDKILSYVEQVEDQDVLGSEWEVVGFVEPGAFKGLSDFVGNETRGQGRVEVLDMAVTHEDD